MPDESGRVERMAEERLKDAKALLDGGRWDFAYYTAGYAVECGLKSCILAQMIHTAWIFEEKWDAKVCLVHEFAKLVHLAGLTEKLENALKTARRPAENSRSTGEGRKSGRSAAGIRRGRKRKP